MSTCTHFEWLCPVLRESQLWLEVSDRFDKLLRILPEPYNILPSPILFIGGEDKGAALHEFGVQGSRSGDFEGFGNVWLHDPLTLASRDGTLTIFALDADICSKIRSVVAFPDTRCHEVKFYQSAPGFEFKSASEAISQMYHRLLFPLVDAVCLFIDDMGGLDCVGERLATWIHDCGKSPSRSGPYLFLIFDAVDSTTEAKVRGFFRRKYQKGVLPTFRGYRIFSASRVPQTRQAARQGSPWSRLRGEIINCLNSVRRSRLREGMLFSVPHLLQFFYELAQRLPVAERRVIDFVKIARTSHPVATDLEQHLLEALVPFNTPEALKSVAIPMIVSSFILDSYPPGMHLAVKPDTAGVRVLSIDGGGTRGRAPLEFLQALQDRLGLPYPLQRNFDLIYGTSSGAIIAAVLYAHNWRIEDCTKYFQLFARKAFQPRWWWLRIPILSTVFQVLTSFLLDSRYSSESLEIILQRILGSRSIMAFPCAAAFGTKLGIPVTTIRDATACVFTSYNGIASDYHILKPSGGMGQIPLWEIVRCSTAAP
ncbi:uncharacterized protein JN550_013877 [Neoarthrinium moseri]|uniref:uncharacterized protein n=1 Tax=Neoarthrinium moseri TaxID=1658444 RepID=UPI001FDB2E17|nr:uncharacterized protein JN550_013877 [Neoarthrinium moseri]KAI1856299.1 hypothetical protein JN550_013877 [Neoarthrinium moseri]